MSWSFLRFPGYYWLQNNLIFFPCLLFFKPNMKVFSVLEWKQSFSSLYVCGRFMLEEFNYLSHGGYYKSLGHQRLRFLLCYNKQFFIHITTQKSEWDLCLLSNLDHRFFFLFSVAPQKQLKKTDRSLKASILRKHYTLETPMHWRFFDYSTQSSLEYLKNTRKPMPFSKMLPLDMDFKYSGLKMSTPFQIECLKFSFAWMKLNLEISK